MSSWARRGGRCVCIGAPNGRWRNFDTGEQIDGPIKLQRLKIVGVETDDLGQHLEFAEWPDRLFRAAWFRPVVEPSQEQDVAMFVHHLLVTPVSGERVSA